MALHIRTRENAIERIWKLLSKHYGQVSAVLECSDDVSRPFRTLDSVLGYPNHKDASIDTIEISARSGHITRASISLSTTRNDLYRYRLEGTEDEILALSQKLEVVLRDLRPWYLWLSRTNAIGVAFLMTVMADVVRDALRQGQERDMVEVLPLAATAIIVIGGALFLMLSPLNRLVFPYGYFRLGSFEERFKHLDYMRWAVNPGAPSFLVWLWRYL